jgi:hypothetical protein
MATQTNTEAKASVAVTVTPKLLTALSEYVSAQTSLTGKFNALAETLRAEANRQGLDRDGANKLAQAAWIEFHKLPSTEPLPMKYRPDVSKVLTLAYPAKPAAEKELRAAQDHNKKAGATAARIGVNTLLEIARGNITVKQALNGKAASKRSKSGLDTVSTPQERFAASVKGMLETHRVGTKNRVSADEAAKIFADTLATYVKENK